MNHKQIIEQLGTRNSVLLQALGDILAHLLKKKDTEGCLIISEAMQKLLQ